MAKARRVNYLEPMTFLCCRLGMLGFSTDFIMRETGMSKYQIVYRLHGAEIRRMDYRNGKTALAAFVLKKAKAQAELSVRERIKPLLEAHKEEPQ